MRNAGDGIAVIRLAAVVFLASFLPYLLTLAPSITWRNGGIDSGEMVAAIATLGIPHPSGFPTYLMVGKLFTLIPIGDLAYRVNLMSAFFGALTAATIAAVCFQLVPRPARWPAAATGALLFAYSPLFWSRATVAKEYTLHLWLIAVLCLCLVSWRKSGRRSSGVLMGVALGLGLGDHPTILSIVPAAVLFAYLEGRTGRIKESLRVLASAGAVALVVAAAVYAYLPLRAAQHPPLDWDDPETLAGFLAHVSGSAYGDLVFSLDPAALARRLAFAVTQIPAEYGWVGGVCFLTGLWTLAARDRSFAAFAALLAAENVLFATAYPVRDSEVYLLPALLLGSIFVGAGLAEVAGGLSQLGARAFSHRSGGPALAASVLGALVLASQLWRIYPTVDVHADLAARDYGLAALREADPGAIILSNQDASTFSLWYAQQALGQRPDVVVVDEAMLDWPWYRQSLNRAYPDLRLPDGSPDPVEELRSRTIPGRPLYRALPPDLSLGRVEEPVVEKLGP